MTNANDIEKNVNEVNETVLSENQLETVNGGDLADLKYEIQNELEEHAKGSSMKPYTREVIKDKCVIEGTSIALAGGSYKKVEELELGDVVLTWNFIKGEYELKPIIANHVVQKEDESIIYASFSDGTRIGISWEHGFFDVTRSQYVFFREDARQYVGEHFVKRNAKGELAEVVLTDVEIKDESVRVFSPITENNLCLFTNDILSITGGVESFINMFDIDVNKMQVDKDRMREELDQYGLLEYCEVSDFIPKRIYDDYGVKYFSVAIGKGYLTLDGIKFLACRFADIIFTEESEMELYKAI